MHSENRNLRSDQKFTVVIPTKDRAEYLGHTLRTCTMQDYDNLEIIVSDDGSSDHTKDVVLDAARRDSRIHYQRNKLGAGMRDNFEFALSLARPGYVIALGGDDGLLPNGISGMNDELRASGMDMLSWAAPQFTYPGVNDDRGQLMLYHPKKSKIINSSEFLARQAAHLDYLGDVESPMLYVKGVVSTRLIEQVRKRSVDGRFYRCPTPDGYSGIVLAGEVAQYAFSGKPFSIYGLSPRSQGQGYLSNTEESKRHSESFFRSVEAVPMHEQLAAQPYSPLISIMTVDYLLHARDLPGWGGTVPDIDFKKVLRIAVRELGHGLYGSDRLQRELLVLQRIAARQDLDSYFRDMVDSSRRKLVKSPLTGYGISWQNIFLDASEYNVENIEQASHAVCYIERFYSDLGFNRVLSTLRNSIRYFLSSIRSGDRFPQFS